MTVKNARGMKYGRWTLVHMLSTKSWECVCDCGAESVRNPSSLHYHVKAGYVPACDDCARQMRADKSEARQAAREPKKIKLRREDERLDCTYYEQCLTEVSHVKGTLGKNPEVSAVPCLKCDRYLHAAPVIDEDRLIRATMSHRNASGCCEARIFA